MTTTDDREPVLCYVDPPLLYFTTLPLAEQTGDDWGDGHYSSNAGTPYTYDEHERRAGWAPWSIVTLAYVAALDTPDDRPGCAYHSVDAINARATPWLRTAAWLARRGEATEIWAGTPLAEVAHIIVAGGGMVYAPIDGSADRWIADATGMTP